MPLHWSARVCYPLSSSRRSRQGSPPRARAHSCRPRGVKEASRRRRIALLCGPSQPSSQGPGVRMTPLDPHAVRRTWWPSVAGVRIGRAGVIMPIEVLRRSRLESQATKLKPSWLPAGIEENFHPR
jgi:hypothetical protein